jgi:hypothetical protein
MPSDRWEGHNVPIRFRYTHDWTWADSTAVPIYGGLWQSEGVNAQFQSIAAASLGGASALAVSFAVPNLPVGMTLTINGLAVYLAAANNGASSISYRINVDGAAIGDTLTIGPLARSAYIPLDIPISAGSRVCLERTATVSAPAAPQSVSVGYQVQTLDTPRMLQVSGGVASNINNFFRTPFGRGVRTDNNASVALIRSVLMREGTITAPAIGNTREIQMTSGGADLAAGTVIGSQVALTAGVTSAVGTLGATLPFRAGPTGATFNEALKIFPGNPGTVANIVMSYEDLGTNVLDPEPGLCLLAFGEAGTNQSVGAIAESYGFNFITSTQTEADSECIVAQAGVLKHIRFFGVTDPTATYRMDIIVNSVTAASITIPGASFGVARSILDDDTTEVTLAAGDLVHFKFTRTAGATTQFVMYCTMGFLGTAP